MTQKLTALIPCKNERRNIRPCIESVRPIADEVLVADSGSTDGTLDIVREMGGCRVIEREYVHSANFKNWAIPKAQHPWVLIVDADERVTPQLAAELRSVLAEPQAGIDGYWIGRKNHFLGYHIAHCGWESDDVLRLFRRDVGRYRERWVHAEIELDSTRVRRLKHPFEHFTSWSSDDYWRKMNRYASWGALNMRDEGRRPSLLSMVFRAPMRFLQLYFLRLGFLDGMPGFHVCAYTAFYTFMKQARLWELEHALAQPDPEADLLPFSGESQAARRTAERSESLRAA
ncbi:MAG: glycosyltransferase family 2 protein [Planctomycetota bacterium]|nr:MAG: glycosyltransferase family 2 protein [Planctomycetota bacterium]